MDTRALSQIEIVYRNTAASLTYAQARSGKRLSLGCEEGCDVGFMAITYPVLTPISR